MIRAIADVDSINDPETRRMYIPNCFAERFTELIVRECAYIDFYKRAGISLKDNYRVTKVITEHFGIKQ
jgi:hypothetical protein